MDSMISENNPPEAGRILPEVHGVVAVEEVEPALDLPGNRLTFGRIDNGPPQPIGLFIGISNEVEGHPGQRASIAWT